MAVNQLGLRRNGCSVRSCAQPVVVAQTDRSFLSMLQLSIDLQALESLNKKDMTEIKSYGRPPALVEKVMEAVMILRGNEPTWSEAKRQLGKP